jgi:hypothetical protein
MPITPLVYGIPLKKNAKSEAIFQKEIKVVPPTFKVMSPHTSPPLTSITVFFLSLGKFA